MRSIAINWLMAGIMCLSIFSCKVSQGESLEEKPNVLFIAVDDLNDWTSLYGGPIEIPYIEGLAGRGLFFNHAYCPSPACNPSRVAVMTGLKTSSTGVYGNEFDALLLYKASWKQTFGAKAAFYSADDFATDTNKIWVWTGFKI